MNSTILSILVSLLLVGGALYFTRPSDTESAPSNNNVAMENGTQVVRIDARGGYSPRVTAAQSGIPTVLRVSTNNSFDCSIALAIPALSFRKNLPPSGVIDIPVPPQKAGTSLQGICAMGMYNFVVNFN